MFKLFFFYCFFILSSFASESSPIAVERKALNALDESIETLSAQNLTCKTSAACEVIWFSDRSCGPRSFTLTSKNNGNLEEIRFLAKRSNRRGAHYGVRANDVECVEFEAFEAKCVDKRCKTVIEYEE